MAIFGQHTCTYLKWAFDSPLRYHLFLIFICEYERNVLANGPIYSNTHMFIYEFIVLRTQQQMLAFTIGYQCPKANSAIFAMLGNYLVFICCSPLLVVWHVTKLTNLRRSVPLLVILYVSIQIVAIQNSTFQTSGINALRTKWTLSAFNSLMYTNAYTYIQIHIWGWKLAWFNLIILMGFYKKLPPLEKCNTD